MPLTSEEKKKRDVYIERRRFAHRQAAAWIGIGVTIGLYIFLTIWWASGINLKVEHNTKWIEDNMNLPAEMIQIEKWISQNQDLPVSISKIEAKTEHLKNILEMQTGQLDRMGAKIDKLIMNNAQVK